MAHRDDRVSEFEQAQAWYDSPAYRELRTIRHRSATSKVFTVEALAR